MMEQTEAEKLAKQREDDALIIDNLKSQSENYFETNITYLSAGALGLSLTFIEKIVNIEKAGYIWLLVMSWCFLAATLIINLSFHLVASRYMTLVAEEIRMGDLSGAELWANLKRRNRRLVLSNITTVCTLALGILFFIIFCSVNAYTMSSTNHTNKPVPTQTTEQRAKTMSIPASVVQKLKVETPAAPQSTTSQSPDGSETTSSSSSTK